MADTTQDVKDAAHDAKNDVKDAAHDVKNTLKDAAHDVKNDVKDAVQDAKDKGLSRCVYNKRDSANIVARQGSICEPKRRSNLGLV